MSKTTKPDAKQSLPELLGILALIGPMLALKALVLSMLWDWYIVPAFNAPPLRIVYAFGVWLFIHFLGKRLIMSEPKEDDITLKAFAYYNTAIAGMALALGYIGTLFI
jgi:predicted permease